MRITYSLLIVFVIIILSSCEELLEVQDISTEQVILLAPSDSTVVTKSNVNFSWNEVFEASSYYIQVAQPSFPEANQVVLDTLIVVDSSYVGSKLSKTLLDGPYEWRVKALNSEFETSFTTQFFKVITSEN